MTVERLFVDTNVFLRYLTNDVPAQADAIEQLLHCAAAGDLALVTNSLVMAEIVLTLESYYGLARTDVKGKVLAILNTPGLEVADGDLVLEAIAGYADKGVDFIDALNAAWLSARGLHAACTFDRKHYGRLGVSVHVPGDQPGPRGALP
ncbi:MAG: PIN domain-containing protein [Anaerolineae bacterium]|nr:PIN domain-containing protein [Anaerolineae bacterium]